MTATSDSLEGANSTASQILGVINGLSGVASGVLDATKGQSSNRVQAPEPRLEQSNDKRWMWIAGAVVAVIAIFLAIRK